MQVLTISMLNDEITVWCVISECKSAHLVWLTSFKFQKWFNVFRKFINQHILLNLWILIFFAVHIFFLSCKPLKGAKSNLRDENWILFLTNYFNWASRALRNIITLSFQEFLTINVMKCLTNLFYKSWFIRYKNIVSRSSKFVHLFKNM